MWYDFFNEYAAFNTAAMCCLASGHVLQFLGLFYLIIYNATFHVLPEFESYGMVFLTVGPLVNMCACSLFTTNVPSTTVSATMSGLTGHGSTASFATSSYNFNRRWMVSEIWEFLGICLLNLSMSIHLERHHLQILYCELIGYIFLAFSVILDFNFTTDESVSVSHVSHNQEQEMSSYVYPVIELKTDSYIHMTDCLGLCLLVGVSVGQYYVNASAVKASTKAA